MTSNDPNSVPEEPNQELTADSLGSAETVDPDSRYSMDDTVGAQSGIDRSKLDPEMKLSLNKTIHRDDAIPAKPSIQAPPVGEQEGRQNIPNTSAYTPTVDHSSVGATADFSLGSGDTTDFHSHRPSARPSKSNLPDRVGHYSIKKVLGRGGMGIVYKAKHEQLGRTVALKMVLAGSHASQEQLQRFISEAKAVAHLQHPNIVQIFEVGEHEQLPFFSLEYVNGDSLDKVLAGKPLPAMDAAKLTETLCYAMQYAHDHGVLHRDIKPANVLRTLEGVPKVTDFGLAKRLEDADDSSSTRTGTIMGTPSYMSPEQARGSTHELGPATDQYSLGAMLYEFLTGRPPFLAAKPVDTILKVLWEEPIAPRQLQSSLPVDLETICLKALQKEPEKRYGSCKELGEDLGRFVRGEPIRARPFGLWERSWRWCRRNPLVASLSTAVAIGLVSVAAVSTWSAVALRNKNSELAISNGALNQANSELKSTNEELDVSNQENLRRSERLQQYVQEVFREINKLNPAENPRIRDFKDSTLSKTLPLIDEFTREIPEGGQGVATKISALLELARSYRDQGMVTEAEESLLESVRLARDRVIVQEGSDASRGNLCLCLKELSQLRLELKRDVAASLETLREAESLAENMISDSKAAPNGLGKFPLYRSETLLADIHHLVGVAAFRQGDPATALDAYQKSLALKRKIVDSLKNGTAFQDQDPVPSAEDQKRLADSVAASMPIGMLAYAAALNRCGRGVDAEPILRKSYDQTEKQLSSDPQNLILMRIVVGTAGTLGEFLAWNGQLEEGLKLFERATVLCDSMMEENQESVELRRSAATAYHRRAQWLENLDPKVYSELGQKALSLRQLSAEADPKNDRRQLEWMISLSRFGEVKSAEAIADRFMQSNARDTEVLTEIAQALAQCSPRESTQNAKTHFQTKAIQAIQQAVRHGFKDWVFLESEIDYKPLANHPEFQLLLKNLKAKPTAG